MAGGRDRNHHPHAPNYGTMSENNTRSDFKGKNNPKSLEDINIEEKESEGTI